MLLTECKLISLITGGAFGHVLFWVNINKNARKFYVFKQFQLKNFTL
jgi:hypothetical protein